MLNRVLLVLLFAFFFFETLGPPIDYDLWYHLRVGEEVQTTGQVPHYDTFIGIADKIEPFYRVNDEWGLGWLAWQIYTVGGISGLAVGLSLAVVWLLAMIYAGCRAGGLSPVPSMLLTLLADQLMATRYALRPHLFTQIFAATLVYFYLRAERSERPARWLWAMAPVIVLWTNMHAGISLGVAMVGWWCLLSFLPGARPGWRQSVPAALACLLAVLIRPDGWKLPSYVYTHFHRPLAYAWVMEWRPLSEVMPTWWLSALPLFLVIAFLGLALAVRQRVLRPAYAAPTVGLTYFAFKWVRALGELGAVGVPLTAATWARLKTRPFPSRVAGWVLGAGLLVALGWQLTRPDVFRFELSPRIYPVGAVEFLERHPAPGALFSSNQFGGYLIFRRQRPYFHSVMSAIPDSVIADYMKLRDQPEHLAEMVGRYGLGGFLLHYEYFDNQQKLIEALQSSPDWSLVYFDDVCVLYLPSSLGLPAYRQIHPALAPGPDPGAELERYTSEHPDVTRGWLLLAQFAARQKDPALELKAYDRALALEPENALARLGRAQLRFAAKNFTGALEDARVAVDSAPRYAPAHFNLAVALAATGDQSGARREAEKALQLDPAFEPARRLLQQL